MQFQPSEYSSDNYGGSLSTGLNYAYYRARGYSEEEAAIKVFEYEQGRTATSAEKVKIAAGWSGEDAQLPANVVDQAIQEEKAKAPAPPPGALATTPTPGPEPEPEPFYKHPLFLPTVIGGGTVAVVAAILFWPKGDDAL